MYHTESKRLYRRRYGSAGFGMRNQPCLHTKINNFVETWYFLIILLLYYRVGIYLIHCKLLYQKTKRKGFIFPPSHGIPPKWKQDLVLWEVCVLYVARTCCCLWVEYEVEFLGNIVVILRLLGVNARRGYPKTNVNFFRKKVTLSENLFHLITLSKNWSWLKWTLVHFVPLFSRTSAWSRWTLVHE